MNKIMELISLLLFHVNATYQSVCVILKNFSFIYTVYKSQRLK